MTEELTDIEKRVLIYLHNVNTANFFPDIKILARVFGISGDEMEKLVLELQDKKMIDPRRHYSDKAPDTGGYRAYIEDTSEEQSSVDEHLGAGGGGEATESQGTAQANPEE